MQDQSNLIRICAHCGQDFEPRRRNQTTYCSKQCKQRAHSKRQREREAPICSVEGCDRRSKHPGLKVPLCSMHDRRKRLRGDVGGSGLERGERFGQLPCVVPGCARKYYSRGYCSLHYNRLRTKGTVGEPDVVKRARGEGTVTFVKGYRRFQWYENGRRRAIFEHHMVMQGLLGRHLYPFERVHHKNGVRHDNRPENLELWTTAHPAGQRPEDLADWLAEHYPELLLERVDKLAEQSDP